MDNSKSSILSCPAALLYFTDLIFFSNSSKVRSLYSIFFSTGNRKSSNVLDVFYILLARFGPTFVKYLLNSSAMRLFFFIEIPLTFIDLGNLLELIFTFSLDFFHYLSCACHAILTVVKYRLIVLLLSFFTSQCFLIVCLLSFSKIYFSCKFVHFESIQFLEI